ncbi:uncharacterized protein LY89DRAFT_546953, partial [Mollisia scopiformis]
EKHQRSNLYGFTTRELTELDCMPTREVKPADVQSYIIPLLQRQTWETVPVQPDFQRTRLYPLKNGNGNWVASNDVVWQVMEPCVRLASQTLMSAHLLPWV